MVSLGTLSKIAKSLSRGHHCVFLGVSLAPGFPLTLEWPLYQDVSFDSLPIHPASNWSSIPKILPLLPIPPFSNPCPQFTKEIFSTSTSQENACIPLWVLLVI